MPDEYVHEATRAVAGHAGGLRVPSNTRPPADPRGDGAPAGGAPATDSGRCDSAGFTGLLAARGITADAKACSRDDRDASQRRGRSSHCRHGALA
ncbi:MAG: hypothetical protein Q4F49_06430 [Pseudoxanthomonas suwonensis]|nr:hypothetical protein [Pseudoxanthomonas suwonensis]